MRNANDTIMNAAVVVAARLDAKLYEITCDADSISSFDTCVNEGIYDLMRVATTGVLANGEHTISRAQATHIVKGALAAGGIKDVPYEQRRAVADAMLDLVAVRLRRDGFAVSGDRNQVTVALR